MARKQRTPGAGTPRALETVCLAADNSRDTAPTISLQASRLMQRFKLSADMAMVVAELAYGQPETWRRS